MLQRHCMDARGGQWLGLNAPDERNNAPASMEEAKRGSKIVLFLQNGASDAG